MENIEALLAEAEQTLPKLPELPELPKRETVDEAVLPPTTETEGGETLPKRYLRQLAALGDIELDVCIELGRTRMRLQDVALLRRGSVVVLDRYVDELVYVLVNGQRIARGKLLVVDGRFSVQLVEFL